MKITTGLVSGLLVLAVGCGTQKKHEDAANAQGAAGTVDQSKTPATAPAQKQQQATPVKKSETPVVPTKKVEKPVTPPQKVEKPTPPAQKGAQPTTPAQQGKTLTPTQQSKTQPPAQQSKPMPPTQQSKPMPPTQQTNQALPPTTQGGVSQVGQVGQNAPSQVDQNGASQVDQSGSQANQAGQAGQAGEPAGQGANAAVNQASQMIQAQGKDAFVATLGQRLDAVRDTLQNIPDNERAQFSDRINSLRKDVDGLKALDGDQLVKQGADVLGRLESLESDAAQQVRL